MGKARGVSMPALELTGNERASMQELASSLMAHNLQQYDELSVTKDGYADSRLWALLQKREGVRVYKETPKQRSANGSGQPPSVLLLGTVQGNLEDLMYAVVAPSTERMKAKSKCINDGVEDCKVLAGVAQPTLDAPFQTMLVSWRYYSLSEPRDFVCMEATGMTASPSGERLGYHLVHSVGFDKLPTFAHRGVERANLSVCSFYRQKSPTHVECYSRGFYDFNTTNEMLNAISLHAVATQWLSTAKLIESAQMRKLARLVENNPAYTDSSDSDSGSGGNNSGSSSGSNTVSSYSGHNRPMADSMDSMSSTSSMALPAPPTLKPLAPRCKICGKSFRFLGAKRKTCKGCNECICTKCSSSQEMVLFSKRRNEAQLKKKTFCSLCVNDAARSDASVLLKNDLLVSTAEHNDVQEFGWH